VLRLTYLDRDGARTERVVEPVVLAAVRGRQWYLVAHCRLRRGPRAFRIDRVVHAAPTGERAPAHSHEAYTLKTCDLGDRAPDLAASSRP
jgi:predicted DNA-binding transcriptional regulator YafY